jgi:catechol 2,3-dioxygenase-like lactoylglutathione lyase family enzyme
MTLLHVSISASEPERVAAFLGRVMGGRAMPFPPFPASWIAFGAADDGIAVEVYPLTHRLVPGPETIACESGTPDAAASFAHAAIASPFDADHLVSLGSDQGWISRICDRGPFQCVEIWLENRILVELLDPAMQEDYRRGMTMENWAGMFGLQLQE